MWAQIAAKSTSEEAKPAVKEDVSPFADAATKRVLVVDAGPLIKVLLSNSGLCVLTTSSAQLAIVT